MTTKRKPIVKREGAAGPVDQFQMLLFATKDRELSDVDIAVLAEIADRCEKERFAARGCSVGHLAKETGWSERAIRYAIDRLIERGYITIATEKVGSKARTYSINVDWVRETDFTIRRAKDGQSIYVAPLCQTNSAPAIWHNRAPLRDLIQHPGATCGLLMRHGDATQPYQGTKSPLDRSNGALAPDALAGAVARAVDQREIEPKQVTVTDARVEREDKETWLSIELESDAGIETRCITIESTDSDDQTEGQRELSAFTYAIGLPVADETDLPNLIGRKAMLVDEGWYPVD